uniref:Uncharacterized protein n=1 Tax=Picea glauca TaxID=3330 RepID=A0A101M1Z5_PICGL|nr:hypothetical protein ABT39_MTgene2750 [Picea glauca]
MQNFRLLSSPRVSLMFYRTQGELFPSIRRTSRQPILPQSPLRNNGAGLRTEEPMPFLFD